MAESDFGDEYDYYDEDEFFLIDDGLANEVDDLAEHTMHSPVLINCDPGFIDDYSGWEYDTDDYYDGDGDGAEPNAGLQMRKPSVASEKAGQDPNPAKRKRSDSISRKRKRRKQDIIGEIPDLDLDESKISDATLRKLTRPLVVWRKEDQRQGWKVPLVDASDGDKVSLLKDWRERLGVTEIVIKGGGKTKSGNQLPRKREKSTKTTSLPSNAGKGNNVTKRPAHRSRTAEHEDGLNSGVSDTGDEASEHAPPADSGLTWKKTGENTMKTENDGRKRGRPTNMTGAGARKSKRIKNG